MFHAALSLVGALTIALVAALIIATSAGGKKLTCTLADVPAPAVVVE